MFEGRGKDAEEVKNIFILLMLLAPAVVHSQEMRFKFEDECSTPSANFKFECKSSNDPDLTILRNGSRYTAFYAGSGTTFDLKVVKSDRYIIVLERSVSFSGTSMIHITPADNRFYWVEVAYSEIRKSREVTIRSGRRIK